MLFSLPAGTEMFHFPAFPPHTLCVQVWVTPHDWCRVSPFGHPGISLVGSSPRTIAASRVLHRLLVPRHSPFALDNLTTKMLASTVQFSNNGQPQPPPNHHTHRT